MSRALLLLSLCACGRLGFAPGDDGGRDDDANVDGAPANMFYDVSVVPAPLSEATLDIESFGYNSDSDMLVSNPSGVTIAHASVIDSSRTVPVRILSFTTFDVRTSLTITGSMPVAIVAESITISAEITVKAGARVCGAGAGVNSFGSTAAGGAGGGAGGSFGASGGDGGIGNNDGMPAAGGVAGPVMFATPLRGGCAGGNGGNGPGGDVGGSGGDGGGGLVLDASMIVVSGLIRAQGFAGDGGDYTSGNGGDAGGGGGGSGGMIVLVSPALTLTGARLFANGGAGGEGSLNGIPGADGASGIDADTPALPVDTDADPASDGGNGGHRSQPAGTNAAVGAVGGAGGGGGGVGWIVVSNLAAASAATLISPAPTSL